MLNFLSSGNQKQIVGLSLVPGIGLQAVVLNKATMSVVNFGSKRVDYNFSTRDIQDYGLFKSAVDELMNEMGIPPKSYVHVVVPTSYFDFVELPPTTSDAEMKGVFLSKAEEFYLFKKEEPISGYAEVVNTGDEDQKRWAYSSLQKSLVDSIREVITDLGLQLVGIETDYSALLRGMQASGVIDDVVFENAPWTAMVVNSNSFVLFEMDGKHLVNCSETPVAIRSYSTEEAYDAIVASATQLLQGSASASKLYIISQIDEISANVLKSNMDFVGEVVAINTNRHSTQPVIEVEGFSGSAEPNRITFSAIGASYINKKDSALILNVIADDPNANLGVYKTVKFLGGEVDITSDFIAKLCITLSIILGGALGGLAFAAHLFAEGQAKIVSDSNAEIKKIESQINQFSEAEKKPQIDITDLIDEIAKQSVEAINFYDSIATDIPKNVWLTRYYNKDGAQIAVRGVAQNIVDIYDYYNNLRLISPQSNIKLTELKVITDSAPDTEEAKYVETLIVNKNVDRLYSFEISNIQIDFTSQRVQMAPNPSDDGEFTRRLDQIKAQESVIIKSNDGVEQTSSQMKPAN